MAKLWIGVAFSVIYPFTSEVYHTKYRTTGFGMASACSRIGGMLMPWVALYSFAIAPTAPYVVYGCCCILATIAGLLLPYDTRGRELDRVSPERKPKVKHEEVSTIEPEV